jgi:hypothetical protein
VPRRRLRQPRRFTAAGLGQHSGVADAQILLLTATLLLLVVLVAWMYREDA